MNKRIKELAQKAGVSFLMEDDHSMVMNGKDLEMFAELIVRECCEWIDGSPSTDAGQLLLTKSFIIANLKGHFGVE